MLRFILLCALFLCEILKMGVSVDILIELLNVKVILSGFKGKIRTFTRHPRRLLPYQLLK